MNVRKIVAAWLTANGYSGLYDDDGSWDGCGCELADLMPCGGEGATCKPGVKRVPAEPDADVEWYIGPKEEGP